jgi:hypothetical protein
MFQIAVRFLHIEVLAKAQVAEDVEDQVVDLVGHVERLRPFSIYTLSAPFPEEIDPATASNITSAKAKQDLTSPREDCHTQN